jgi:hypothetical protein
MVRGGSRQGAGRKSTWASGCTFKDTTLIRVPSRLALILLELAHKLDAGEVIDFATKSENQESVDIDCNLSSVEDTQIQQEYDLAVKPEDSLSNTDNEKQSDFVTKSEKPSDMGKEPSIGHEAEKLETPIQLELFTRLTEPSFNLESVLSNPVPEKLLARRLRMGVPALTKKKKLSPAIFYAWLQKKDPNNIQWKAAEESKCYLPDENTPPEALKKLQSWLEKNK